MSPRRRPAPVADEVDYPYIGEALHHLAVPIDDLTPDPENARLHDQINREAIRASLEKFGQMIPIVVQRDGMVVRVGNGRLQEAKELGWTHIAAIVTDTPAPVMKALAIADNRTGELARWHRGELARLLDELQDIEGELIEGVGFDMREVESLIATYLPEVAADSGLVSSPESSAVASASQAPNGTAPYEAGSENVREQFAGSAITNIRYVNLSFPAEDHTEFLELVRFFANRYQTTITPDAILKSMREFKESLRDE